MGRQQGLEPKDEMLACRDMLRKFAISLCGNVDRADDLVQETMLQAWAYLDSYETGTNMAAWLFTILRNLFRSQYRKLRREVADSDGLYAETLISPAGQFEKLALDDLRAALPKIPADQREALMLTSVSGFTYEETGDVCGCATGTVKSRVHRARAALADLLGVDQGELAGMRRTVRRPRKLSREARKRMHMDDDAIAPAASVAHSIEHGSVIWQAAEYAAAGVPPSLPAVPAAPETQALREDEDLDEFYFAPDCKEWMLCDEVLYMTPDGEGVACVYELCR